MELEDLENLAAVARTGSISAGARELGRPKQSVSRRLIALEAELGVRLIDRTTRSLRLTADGSALHDHARRILNDVAEVRSQFADRGAEPSGPLRVSAPNVLGESNLGAIAAAYALRYPNVDLEIVLSDRRVDLIDEGFDAAIRGGPAQDSSLVGRLIGTSQFMLVASPVHLKAHGKPKKPAELADHVCVMIVSREGPIRWRLESGSASVPVTPKRSTKVSSPILAREMSVAGAGIALVPSFLVAQDLQAGRLVRVLPKWQGGSTEVRILHPSNRLVSARLRAFIDLLVAEFPKRL